MDLVAQPAGATSRSKVHSLKSPPPNGPRLSIGPSPGAVSQPVPGLTDPPRAPSQYGERFLLPVREEGTEPAPRLLFRQRTEARERMTRGPVPLRLEPKALSG